MSTFPKSLLLFGLRRRKISGMVDLFRESSAQELEAAIQRNKKADGVKGGRGSPVRKFQLLLTTFHPSGSHYVPPPSPSRQCAAPSPARPTGRMCSPQQRCGFAGFRAEKRWSISSPVWLKEAGWLNSVLLVQRRVAKKGGGRGEKQDTPLLWDKLLPLA